MPPENDLYQEWMDKIGTKPIPWHQAKAILAEVERRRQERALQVADRLLGRKPVETPEQERERVFGECGGKCGEGPCLAWNKARGKLGRPHGY